MTGEKEKKKEKAEERGESLREEDREIVCKRKKQTGLGRDLEIHVEELREILRRW